MEVSDFIIVGILLLITSLIRFYIPNYIKEKGKNLAQKEDIDEITRKVEAVKHEFNKKNEEIRSELSVVPSHAVAA